MDCLRLIRTLSSLYQSVSLLGIYFSSPLSTFIFVVHEFTIMVQCSTVLEYSTIVECTVHRVVLSYSTNVRVYLRLIQDLFINFLLVYM